MREHLNPRLSLLLSGSASGKAVDARVGDTPSKLEAELQLASDATANPRRFTVAVQNVADLRGAGVDGCCQLATGQAQPEHALLQLSRRHDTSWMRNDSHAGNQKSSNGTQ
jgi:hypothetical protein